MSWLYSQALVEEYLGDISLDGEQSVPLNGSNTQQAYCAPDKMKGFSRLSRYGMTYKPLTESRGEELLKSYLGAFPVRTLVLQEKVMDLMEKGQECGERWHGLLAKYNPNTHSWKTVQCSLLEDLELSLEIWPKWGLMQNGVCWEQTPLELPTSETAFGFSLPTPVASDATSGAVIGKNDMFYTTSTGMPRKVNQNGKDGSVGLGRLVQMWPTPTVGCTEGGEQSKQVEMTQTGSFITRRVNKPHMTYGAKLSDAVLFVEKKMWGTPKAQDSRHALRDRGKGNLGEQVSGLHNGGKLSPLWTEWLMGWPIGWTDLKPLEMDKSLYVQQPLGES